MAPIAEDTREVVAPPDGSKPAEWEIFWKHERGDTWLGKVLLWLRERWWVEHFVQVALDHTTRGRVLEAGCGSALSSVFLSKQRGDVVAGLDLSDGALAVAREAAYRHGVRLGLIKGDMLKLPCVDQSADLVWSCGTLEHFDDPVSVVREMRRVGRQIIAIVPSKGWVFGCLEQATKLLSPRYRSAFVGGDEHWYTREELDQIFHQAGCQEVKVKEIRCLGVFPYWAAIAR